MLWLRRKDMFDFVGNLPRSTEVSWLREVVKAFVAHTVDADADADAVDVDVDVAVDVAVDVECSCRDLTWVGKNMNHHRS
jgi:hypothetical protein